MAKLVFLILLISITLNSGAQERIKGKRIYKVEGYILSDKDTVNGFVAIPIKKDELDYNALRQEVTFIDDQGNTETYDPHNLSGFGLRADGILGDYISFNQADGLDKTTFLKKLVDGDVLLLIDNFSETKVYQGMTTYTSGVLTSSPTLRRTVDKAEYYLKVGNEKLKKLPLKAKTASIQKKDLKALLANLPDSFGESTEEIDISEVMNLLSSYKTR